MNKERLAIVSSYNELCGNASYTKALEQELAQYFDVSVLSLNVDLLRKSSTKHSQRHIKEICQQLQHFDCVNIQFEAGLFGSKLSKIKKNFFRIAKASKRLVITMHRYQSLDKYPSCAAFFRDLLLGKIKNYLTDCRKAYANNRYVPLYKCIIKYCKNKNIPIIVHTKRDKELIELEFNYPHVFSHPISFYSQQEISILKEKYDKKTFCRDLGLDIDKIYIGIFGFINHYKGHKTIIQTLCYLPEQYELLICGSQHPHSIQIDTPVDNYIQDLLNMIDRLNLSQRVKFYHFSSDTDFLKALIGCDFNVLPYLEVKQGGSAVASLSLETNSRAIFAQNFAFFELEKYAPNSFKMFSIGNYLELANAIITYDSERYATPLKKYHSTYNIQTSGRLYRDLLKRESSHLQVKDALELKDVRQSKCCHSK